jgi:ribonuclease VapC
LSQVVLDASAVLAYLWKEKGWSKVEQHLLSESVLISSVNLAEVASKALERGMDQQVAREMLANLGMQEIAFDSGAAWKCALLRVPTRQLGLSLGDRACLALASATGSTAVTADQSWKKLATKVMIECIR